MRGLHDQLERYDGRYGSIGVVFFLLATRPPAS